MGTVKPFYRNVKRFFFVLIHGFSPKIVGTAIELPIRFSKGDSIYLNVYKEWNRPWKIVHHYATIVHSKGLVTVPPLYCQ